MEETTEKSAKERALEVVGALPNDATFEDIQYELYVRQKIERGLEAAREGRMVSHDEAKRRMARWTEK